MTNLKETGVTAFKAPEVLTNSSSLILESDMFSLGVILHFMMAKALPSLDQI